MKSVSSGASGAEDASAAATTIVRVVSRPYVGHSGGNSADTSVATISDRISTNPACARASVGGVSAIRTGSGRPGAFTATAAAATANIGQDGASGSDSDRGRPTRAAAAAAAAASAGQSSTTSATSGRNACTSGAAGSRGASRTLRARTTPGSARANRNTDNASSWSKGSEADSSTAGCSISTVPTVKKHLGRPAAASTGAAAADNEIDRETVRRRRFGSQRHQKCGSDRIPTTGIIYGRSHSGARAGLRVSRRRQADCCNQCRSSGQPACLREQSSS